MITVKITKKGNEISNILVTGHAFHSEHGTDIVCAATTAFITMYAENLCELGFESNVQIGLDEGYFNINILESNSQISKLTNVLIGLLNEVQKQYSKNLTIKEV